MGNRVVPANGRAALVGFSVPDDRLNVDNLQSGSSYEQASPQPGTAVPSQQNSRYLPIISGEQSSSLMVQAGTAGFPEPNGARALYRYTAETNEAYRGWSPGNFLNNWSAGEWDASTTYCQGTPSACTIPSSQKIAVVYCNSTNIYFKLYNPFDNTWGSRITIVTSATAPRAAAFTDGLASVVCIPNSERLLMIFSSPSFHSTGFSYYSDDNGTTWTLFTGKVFPSSYFLGASSFSRTRLLYNNGFLVYSVYAGTNEFYVLVSSNFGSSWTEVESTVGTANDDDIIFLPDGRLAYIRNEGSPTIRPKFYAVPTPYFPRSTATGIELSTTAVSDELLFAIEPGGAILVYGRYNDNWYVYRSVDAGVTWRLHTMGLYTSEAPVAVTEPYFTRVCATTAAGGVYIAHQWESITAVEGSRSLAILRAAGWANLTTDYPEIGSPNYADADVDKLGFGPTTITGKSTGTVYAHTWLPFDVPSDQAAWGKTGTGTTTLLNDSLRINTTGNQGYFTPATTAPNAAGYVIVLADIEVVSGGALATNDVAIRIKCSNTTNGLDFTVRCATTGVRVRDLNAGVNYDATFTGTSRFQIFIGASHMDSEVVVAWKRPYDTKWTKIVAAVFTKDASVTASSLQWGHLVNSTATSQWRMFCFTWDIETMPFMYTEAVNSYQQKVNGLVLTGKPVALGDTATAGAMFLSASAGPAFQNEVFTIAPNYEYGVDKLFYDVAPSLAEEWRSTSTAEQTFHFAPSAISSTTNTNLNSTSVAIGFFGGNFETAYFEGYNGSSWTTLGTYTASTGLSGLTASVSGDIVTPNTSTTAAASRYLQRSELDGAVAVVNGVYAYIVRQTEGGWTTASTKRPMITVDRAVTAGSCKFIARNGVLVIHNLTTNYQQYRIRIPTQSTPDSFFRLAGLVIGGLAVPGLPWDWGWTDALEPNVSEQVSKRGTTRRKEEGPPRRTLSFAWSNGGVPLYRLRAGVDNDYLAADSSHSAAAALATYKDVPWVMGGVLRDCASGQIPVIALKVIPEVATSTTITDPTLYLYGRMTGTVQQAQVTGKTNQSEYVRVDSVAIEELL